MSDAVAESIFTEGGAVQAGSGIYIPRRADEELLRLCRARKYAYILTARQMGKSSLMVRTAEELREEGTKAVIIDLTKTGASEGITEDEWYYGLLEAVNRRLKLGTDLVKWWEAHSHLSRTERFASFFEEEVVSKVPPSGVVVFIDEIDTTISLKFSDDFFAAIRYLFQARSVNDELHRLSFVLIGVARPDDLIADAARTPFNIGKHVVLTDFTYDEAEPFADGLGLPPEHAREVLRWILDWTGGHPYLTQRLCLAVFQEAQRQGRTAFSVQDVDRLVKTTFFSKKSEDDRNLGFVRDMLLRRIPKPLEVGDVLLTYRNVLSGRRPVPDEERSLLKSHLKLSGVVCPDGGVLRVRNRLYRTAFDKAWIKEHLPTTVVRQQYRRVRKVAMYLAAGLLVIGGLAAFAWNRAIAAENQRQIAEIQTRVANAERAEADRQRDLARELAAEAALLAAEAENQRKKAETSALQAAQEAARAQKAEAAERAAREAESSQRRLAEERAIREQRSAERAEKAQMEAAEARDLAQQQAKKLADTLGEVERQRALAQGEADRATQATVEAERRRTEAELRARAEKANREVMSIFIRRDSQNLQQAIDKLESDALDAYDKLKDPSGKALTLTNIALAYGQLLDRQKSLESYVRAREAYRSAGDFAGEADTRMAIGDTLDSLLVPSPTGEDQLDNYTKAREAYAKAQDTKGEAAAYMKIGDAILRRAQRTDLGKPLPEEAISGAMAAYRKAHELYGSTSGRDPFNGDVAAALLRLAEVSYATSQRDAGIGFYKEAFQYLRRTGDTNGQYYALSALLKAYRAAGEEAKGLKYVEELRAEYQKGRDRTEETVFLMMVADFYRTINQQRALEYYDAARKTAQTLLSDYYSLLPQIFSQVWRMYSGSEGDRLVAQRYFDSVAAEARNAGDLYGEARATQFIGESLLADPEARLLGLDKLRRAYQIYLQNGYTSMASSVLLKMRTPSFDLSNAVTTRRLITDLTRLSKDTPAAEPAKKADALYTLGLLYRATDDKAGAEKLFLEAASLYRSAGDRRQEAGAFFALAALYRDRPYELGFANPEKALENFEKARKLYDEDPVDDDFMEARTLQAIAGVRRSEQDYLRALSKLREADKAPGVATATAEVQEELSGLYESSQNDKAIAGYEQAARLYRQAGNRSGEAQVLRTISSIYGMLGENAKAMEYVNRAAQVYAEAGDILGQAHLFANRAGYVSNKSTPDKPWSAELLKKAAELYGAARAIQFQITTLRNLATLYTEMKMVKEASEANARADALGGYKGLQLQNLGLIQDRPEPGPPVPVATP